eukprot:scaffold72604_cov18-Tisochrysis_lutea.AAC.1
MPVNTVVFTAHEEIKNPSQRPGHRASDPHSKLHNPEQACANLKAMSHTDGLRQQVPYDLWKPFTARALHSSRSKDSSPSCRPDAYRQESSDVQHVRHGKLEGKPVMTGSYTWA